MFPARAIGSTRSTIGVPRNRHPKKHFRTTVGARPSPGLAGTVADGYEPDIVTRTTKIELVRKANKSMGELTLPRRAGGAPRTTTTNPQQQLDQIPDLAEYQTMREIVTGWTNVIHRPSLRAPEGALGIFLSDHDARGPKEAFLLGTEFAHLHPLPDGSLHMVLPPKVHDAAIEKGWGVPHPMAGLPTVSPQTILIFAPRDATERGVVVSLIRSAETYARGG
jgi:Family of unknown function (DUF5519)